MNSLEAAPPFVKPMKSVLAAPVFASLHARPIAAVQTAVVAPVPALVARVATPPLRLVFLACPTAPVVFAATQTTAALFVAALEVKSARMASACLTFHLGRVGPPLPSLVRETARGETKTLLRI